MPKYIIVLEHKVVCTIWHSGLHYLSPCDILLFPNYSILNHIVSQWRIKLYMGTTWNNEKKKMPKSYYWENNNNKVQMNLFANIIIPRRIVYIKPICSTQALYTLIACIYYKLDILQLFFKIDYPLNMKFKGWNFQAISLCLPFLTNKISYWTTCNCTNHSTKSQYISKQRELLIGTHGKERKEK